MSNMTAPALSQPEAEVSTKERVIRVLIVVQGVITVGLTMVYLPVGLVAVVLNAALAFTSRGVKRKLFAGFAIAGAVVGLAIGLGLMAASGSGTTQVTPLG